MDTSTPASPAVTKKEIRTVVASCVVGTTVEWYDFFLYGTAAGIVFNQLYFPNDDPLVATMLAFATFAVGFVARPLGGLVFGHIGDKVGRKKTLVATMLLMGVATCLIGLLPTHEQIGIAAPIALIVLRIAQGVAVGGEWGGAVLMAVEYAPAKRRGLYGSLPQIGLALGLMLGTGIFAGLNAGMSDESFLSWGWRIAFLLSAILVVAGLFIRLKVMETPAFRKLEEREEHATVPALELARVSRNRRHVLLGMGSRWVEGVAFNTWAVFAIAYGTGTLQMSQQTLLVAVMIASAFMLAFIPLFGRVSDVLGRRQLFAAGAVLAGVLAVPAFAALGTGDAVVVTVAIVVVLGVFYPMMYGPQAAFYAELFPTRVRYTGISFVYQFSGIFASGLTPLILTYLLDRADGGISLVVAYLLVAGAVSAACALAVRPRDLEVDDEAPSATAREPLAAEPTG
jgi:metabolite-proton symporter